MMNTLLTTILIGMMCFGAKLKVEESNFKEIAPGIATGYVVTKYEVKIKSSSGKKILIDQVWLKNRKVSWELMDSTNKNVETIGEKGSYTLKGAMRNRSAGAKFKSKPVKEELASFAEDFVVQYKVEGSDEMKLLTIEKIENLELVKMQ